MKVSVMCRPLFVLVLILLCTACMPSIPHSVDQSSAALMQPPAADKATVVFVGLKNWQFALYDSASIVGVTGDRECAVAKVSQGKHLFSSFFRKTPLMDGRNRYSFIDTELAQGKIYYILVRPYIIPFAGVFSDLEPIREKNDPNGYWMKLPAWLSDCKVTVMTDETIAWSREMYADNASNREKDHADWLKDEERPKKTIFPEDGVTMPVAPKH